MNTLAADRDTDGHERTDDIRITEIRSAADTHDAWDTDPDTENYDNGNIPGAAYRDQGNPDSPTAGTTTPTTTVTTTTSTATVRQKLR